MNHFQLIAGAQIERLQMGGMVVPGSAVAVVAAVS